MGGKTGPSGILEPEQVRSSPGLRPEGEGRQRTSPLLLLGPFHSSFYFLNEMTAHLKVFQVGLSGKKFASPLPFNSICVHAQLKKKKSKKKKTNKLLGHYIFTGQLHVYTFQKKNKESSVGDCESYFQVFPSLPWIFLTELSALQEDQLGALCPPTGVG